MTASFRHSVGQSLSSDAQLSDLLRGMSADEWDALAELFAAQLPEFDAVYGLSGAEVLAGQVAQIRGVKDLTGCGFAPQSGETPGELVLLAAHLQEGQDAQDAVTQARAAGWQVHLLGTAVERTSLGARAQLLELEVPVRAAVQVADTPSGLVFERRSPDRWLP